MPPQQYRPSRRSWVKLWTEEWITGTIRWQLTAEQRSLFIDILAAAGRSRFPGYVCGGETNGHKSGYPLDYLAAQFRCTVASLREALALFESQGRIKLQDHDVIRVINWEKYQSEYMLKRQRTTYNSPHKVRKMSAQNATVLELEVEVEGEKREKERKIKTIAQQNPLGVTFEAFWLEYPKKVGKPAALKSWKAIRTNDGPLILAGLAKWKLHWSDPQYIPYPATWLNQRRWEDDPPKSGQEESRDAIERAAKKYAS